MQTISPIDLEPQPKKPNATILSCNHELFITLNNAIRRLEQKDYREFLVLSLTIMTDRPDLKGLSTIALTEMLFQHLEEVYEARRVLNLQNCLVYACQRLLGVADFHASSGS